MNKQRLNITLVGLIMYIIIYSIDNYVRSNITANMDNNCCYEYIR